MTKDDEKHPRTGYAWIASAALIWGSIGIIVRIIPLSPLATVAYRVWFSLPLLLIPWLRHRRILDLRDGAHSKLLFGSGVLQAVAWTAFFTAFKYTTVANAVLLLYTAPIIVAILAPYILREPRQPRVYLPLLLATLGTILIFSNAGLGEQVETLGVLSGLTAGFLFALLIMADRKLSQTYTSQSIVSAQLISAAIILAPAPFLEQTTPSLTEAALLVILGLVHTGFALYLYLKGLRLTPAQHAVVIQYLEPASAIFYAALLLSELPDTTSLLGGGLIVAANLILIAKGRPAKHYSGLKAKTALTQKTTQISQPRPVRRYCR
ncbi:MAG: DMT family transporter [Thaumarchaeota archaeon]|nr:DMT family transporter [Nitrososphaerota archaeon]